MVEILVVNTFLTAEVMFDGDPERLDEVDNGLFLDEGPRPSLLFTECLSGNLWHVVCETRVRRVGVSSWTLVPGTWNHTRRAKVLLPRIIADQN